MVERKDYAASDIGKHILASAKRRGVNLTRFGEIQADPVTHEYIGGEWRHFTGLELGERPSDQEDFDKPEAV